MICLKYVPVNAPFMSMRTQMQSDLNSLLILRLKHARLGSLFLFWFVFILKKENRSSLLQNNTVKNKVSDIYPFVFLTQTF